MRLLKASFQRVRRLFVLAYVVAAGAANDEACIKNNKQFFLQRGDINNYNCVRILQSNSKSSIISING